MCKLLYSSFDLANVTIKSNKQNVFFILFLLQRFR